MKMHPDTTLGRVIKAVERFETTLDDPSLCISCGAESEGVEPDAPRHECGVCGERGV